MRCSSRLIHIPSILSNTIIIKHISLSINNSTNSSSRIICSNPCCHFSTSLLIKVKNYFFIFIVICSSFSTFIIVPTLASCTIIFWIKIIYTVFISRHIIGILFNTILVIVTFKFFPIYIKAILFTINSLNCKTYTSTKCSISTTSRTKIVVRIMYSIIRLINFLITIPTVLIHRTIYIKIIQLIIITYKLISYHPSVLIKEESISFYSIHKIGCHNTSINEVIKIHSIIKKPSTNCTKINIAHKTTRSINFIFLILIILYNFRSCSTTFFFLSRKWSCMKIFSRVSKTYFAKSYKHRKYK